MKTIPLLLHLTTPSALLDQQIRSRVLAHGRRSWLKFRRNRLLGQINFQIPPSGQQAKSSRLDLLDVQLDALDVEAEAVRACCSRTRYRRPLEDGTTHEGILPMQQLYRTKKPYPRKETTHGAIPQN